MLGDVLVQILAFDLEPMTGLGLRCTLDHLGKGGLCIEIPDTECIHVGNDRVGRVPVDLRRIATDDGPLGKPTVLIRFVHE